jgi:hypothetical protein
LGREENSLSFFELDGLRGGREDTTPEGEKRRSRSDDKKKRKKEIFVVSTYNFLFLLLS